MVEPDAADPVAAAQEAAVDDAGTHGQAGAMSDAALQVLPCQFGATSAGGVRTFVVGFTEADAGTVTFLHNVAAAGGTGRAFLPKTLRELQNALREVVGLPVCGEK